MVCPVSGRTAQVYRCGALAGVRSGASWRPGAHRQGPGGERERSPAGIPMRPRRKPPQVVPMPGELGGHKGEALTKLEDEEVRASREPTRGAASTGRQECKGYKITLQEYEENADKKCQQIEFSDLNI